MSEAPDWDLFHSLLAVLEGGSLSAAARARGLSQPTLGRHVETLEARLGASLFVRSPRGLQPTELALELKPHLADMAASAAAAVRDAAARIGEVSGAVRITASEVVGVEVLPPILAAFRAAHPGVSVELVLSNEMQDLLRREADIAVRMTPPSQEALVARRLGDIDIGLHAAPEYLARCGVPASLADLESHALVGVDSERRIRQIDGFQLPLGRQDFAFRADSDLAQLAAIRAGYGVGVCQNALGRRYGLTRVLPERTVARLGVWIVMHENLRASLRMRRMFDHLVEGLAAYVRAGL